MSSRHSVRKATVQTPFDQNGDDSDYEAAAIADDGSHGCYMVMLARSQQGVAERTQIKNMPANQVRSLLLQKDGGEQQVKRDSQWHVVACMGPMKPADAKFAETTWGTTVRGVVAKAAQADVISSHIGVPGYADFKRIIGDEFYEHVKIVPIEHT